MDLLRAAAKDQRNSHGYTYAWASKTQTETLKVWHNGRVILDSVANTGIPAAPTADGTYPVYLRYYYQVMKGTNPDGTKYADPVYYVAYFNGGDAVHYFPRYSYGFPQSLGCVELPWTRPRRCGRTSATARWSPSPADPAGARRAGLPHRSILRRARRRGSIASERRAVMPGRRSHQGACRACPSAAYHPRRTRACGGCGHDRRPGAPGS